MGKKYLDTKKNTLEASILDVWKEAAKLNEYKTKLGEKRRVAGGDMRRTENKKFKESTLQGDEIGEATGKEIAAKMMKDKSMKAFASKVAKMKTVTRNDLEKLLPDYISGGDITKVLQKENYEIGKDYGDHTRDITPGQSNQDFNKMVGVMQKKNMSMREALAKVWGMDEGKNPFKKEDKHKTMTGKPTTKIEVDPDIEDKE